MQVNTHTPSRGQQSKIAGKEKTDEMVKKAVLHVKDFVLQYHGPQCVLFSIVYILKNKFTNVCTLVT